MGIQSFLIFASSIRIVFFSYCGPHPMLNNRYKQNPFSFEIPQAFPNPNSVIPNSKGAFGCPERTLS